MFLDTKILNFNMLDNLAMSMLRFSFTSWYIDNYLSWTSDGGGSTLVAHELVVLYTPPA